MKINLLLEDGTLIEAKGFGHCDTVIGEIVFNTGMTGYQEILTDPSYAGQIVVMTYPLIGNYGVNSLDIESKQIQVKAFIVKEYANHPNHWQMTKSLETYLQDQKIMGVYDIDTRYLTRKIRHYGVMKCLMTPEAITEEKKEALHRYNFPENIVSQVSIKEKEHIKGQGKKVGVIDLGLKQGIINRIVDRGFDVHIFPWDVTKEMIDGAQLDMLLLSNGPGDPKALKATIGMVEQLIGQLPLRGICLGHQVLALALGADTYKLKFGHRGSNHPVIHLPSNRVFITSQNHGYSVLESSIPKEMVVTYENVNDHTIEGLRCETYDVESVQFHPEEGPGPFDGHYILDNWLQELGGEKYANESNH